MALRARGMLASPTIHDQNSLFKELSFWLERRARAASTTARAEGFWGNARHRIDCNDMHYLCSLEFQPNEFSNPEEYFAYAQFAAFYRKRNDVGEDSERERVALVKFIEAERRCYDTNKLIRGWYMGSGISYCPPAFSDVLHFARQEVYRVLGRCPSYEQLPIYFGPGATTQVGKRKANIRLKLGAPFACSESMLPKIATILESMPDFCFRSDVESGDRLTASVEIHPSRLEFVPKSYKTFRSIAVEPWLNSVFQLGIGRVISDRLRKTCRIDTRDQSLNQRLAFRASIDHSLATVDLSSASDLISFELARWLLPPDWFELLLETRSSHVSYKGVVHKLEKFSSMGNGFTFPLQTLFFYSISKAVCKSKQISSSDVVAYGDDIIIPTEAYDLLASSLEYLGFKVNMEKSFHEGPFRESCGKDYWQGIDVRPLFLKNAPTYMDLFTLHNGFIRRGDVEGASIVRKFIPAHLILIGPDGYGDGHLIDDSFSKVHKPSHLKKGWRGYTFDTYGLKGRKTLRPYPGDYLYPSYSIYRTGEESVDLSGSRDSLPGACGYRRFSIYVLN